MTYPVVYDPAGTIPATGPRPGARALMTWALTTSPHATNLGIYNPRPVGTTTTPSTHAEGRAIDVGFPIQRPAGHPDGWKLADTLIDHHRAWGIQQVIFAGKIWRNTRHTEGWRTYRRPPGGSDHYDHVHAELTRAAAAALTAPQIAAALPKVSTMPTIPDNAQEAAQRALNAWLDPVRQITPDGDWGPKSTAALNHLLDVVIKPRLDTYAEQVTALTATNTALHARIDDLQATVATLEAAGPATPQIVHLATIGAKTREWVDTITAELAKLDT